MLYLFDVISRGSCEISALLAHNYLPGSDVARCDNGFAWPTEYACQIETFISSRLDIIGELNHNNVSHCVAILFANGRRKKTNNFVEPIDLCASFKKRDNGRRYLRVVCHILGNLGCR